MNFRNNNSERSIITRDVVEFENDTDNIYESIVIMAKRANQISSELKEELTTKLQEFASSVDNLEEVFENHEQIEISKFYERLAKPTAMAMSEKIDNEIYFRSPEADKE